MKCALLFALLIAANTAFAYKKSDIDFHFNQINQCKFDSYQRLKKDADNVEQGDPSGIQRLKINVDARVSKALIKKSFGNATDEEKKSNNYECLGKLSQYK